MLEHAGDGEGLLSWRRLVAEYEQATAGRETSLLLEVLAQTFKGDARGSLDEFEVLHLHVGDVTDMFTLCGATPMV